MIDFIGDLIAWFQAGRQLAGHPIPFGAFRFPRMLKRLVKSK